MKFYTDMCIPFHGDLDDKEPPVREINIAVWDRDKYSVDAYALGERGWFRVTIPLPYVLTEEHIGVTAAQLDQDQSERYVALRRKAMEMQTVVGAVLGEGGTVSLSTWDALIAAQRNLAGVTQGSRTEFETMKTQALSNIFNSL